MKKTQEPGRDKPREADGGKLKTLPVSLQLQCSYSRFVEWLREYPGSQKIKFDEDRNGIYIKFVSTIPIGNNQSVESYYAHFEFTIKQDNPLQLEGLYYHLDPAYFNKPTSLNDHDDFITLAIRHLGTVKPKKQKGGLPTLPSKHGDALKWCRAWQHLGPKIEIDLSLAKDYEELRDYLRPEDLTFKDDTLREIVKLGRAGGIPSPNEYAIEHNL